ncbi:Apoptosis-inducing factor 1 mitochondrial [Fasciola gigantica]|uniref:Apoptosis-inducing factor 1 mitochondrial n=1 Tax=Fasciola gigantica TaxID=46835 RepID=A0A504YKY5_FASGI|nr:Apoptosis-inducing factor 1 mitochondrial [Fasciola gigantica]
MVAASDVPQQRVRLRVRRNEPGRDTVEEVDVDHVVYVVGIEPNTDLASSACLELDPVHGGFLVNAELETRAGVYAAGDAASYWDPVLGFRRRVEHLNFAEETGQLAGKNMAAAFQPSDDNTSLVHRYHYQSSMWSTLGPSLSWDAVGNVDARHLETRSFFLSEPPPSTNLGQSSNVTVPDALHSIPAADLGRLARGVVFYLTPKEKRLVGVLLWNLPDELYTDQKYAAPGRLNLARSLLAQRRLIGQNPSFSSPEAELSHLASQFDLGGELARDYADLKAFMESQTTEESIEEQPPKSDEQLPEPNAQPG